MNEDKKRKKKSRGKVVVPAAVLAVLAVLFGGRFGLNWGGDWGIGGNSGNNLNGNDAVSSQDSVKPSLIIEVNEDRIIYDGKEVSLDELRSLILERNKSGYIWELQNNHAVKAPYDQVKALLTECDVIFAETESNKL